MSFIKHYLMLAGFWLIWKIQSKRKNAYVSDRILIILLQTIRFCERIWLFIIKVNSSNSYEFNTLILLNKINNSTLEFAFLIDLSTINFIMIHCDIRLTLNNTFEILATEQTIIVVSSFPLPSLSCNEVIAFPTTCWFASSSF